MAKLRIRMICDCLGPGEVLAIMVAGLFAIAFVVLWGWRR